MFWGLNIVLVVKLCKGTRPIDAGVRCPSRAPEYRRDFTADYLCRSTFITILAGTPWGQHISAFSACIGSVGRSTQTTA